MLRAELMEIISNGENSGVEFKRDDVHPEKLAKEIVAMANLRGGKILLGVDDDGSISGIQREDKECERWVMDTVFGHYVHPMLLPYYEVVTLEDGKRVAVISFTMGTSKPYVLRHQRREEIYIRVGSTSRHATREQQARLFEVGGILHSETLPVSGTTLEQLDRARLEDYLLTLVGDKNLPTTDEGWLRRMIGLGFMTDAGENGPVCTIAGTILFCRTPRRYLRQAGIRWMAFNEDDRDSRALDDTTLDGPLVGLFSQQTTAGRELIERGLIEDAMDRIQPFITTEDETLTENVRRQRRWRYPPEALREAIINALIHRDWTRTLEVEIAAYSNRLEIVSPGALQNSMTIEKMLAGQRSPRNPILVEVLRDYGYVDARGMGVRNKIIPLVREASGKEPWFDESEDFVRLTLPNA